MKARIPHAFFLFVQKYSLISMLKTVSSWAFDLYNKPDKDLGRFAGNRYYDLSTGKVMLLQTWLIDLIYELIDYNRYGQEDISLTEALKLIGLYNNYRNATEHTMHNKKDIFLFLYGFFGEQRRFQNNSFFEEFAREKYILEIVSKCPEANSYNIDFLNEFFQETSFSTDVYSANLFVIFAMFLQKSGIASKEDIIRYFKNSSINCNDILKIMDHNSISIDMIRNHSLHRQVLYTRPIINVDNYYIATNPYLLLSLFANSNYWVLRNKYCNIKSQNFINAFGVYFEKYVEEILGRCLNKNEYSKIPESHANKRADWKINIGNFNILVEQKSSLPVLGIKQSQPDVIAIKKHILKAWGEAVEQLSETENQYKLKFIKIILVYDEYFKAEALEELFKLRTDLNNDGYYWLINIREFEILMMLYRNNNELFKTVMNEKIASESTYSHNGRELAIFLNKYKIIHNDYLSEFGIYDETDRIMNYYINQGKWDAGNPDFDYVDISDADDEEARAELV